MPKVEIVYADISPEENDRRLRELEKVLSSIAKVKVELVDIKEGS